MQNLFGPRVRLNYLSLTFLGVCSCEWNNVNAKETLSNQRKKKPMFVRAMNHSCDIALFSFRWLFVRILLKKN